MIAYKTNRIDCGLFYSDVLSSGPFKLLLMITVHHKKSILVELFSSYSQKSQEFIQTPDCEKVFSKMKDNGHTSPCKPAPNTNIDLLLATETQPQIRRR